MKIELQYVNDMNGETKAVQLPLIDWEKVLNKLKKYEQALKLRSDLKEAFKEVASLKKQKGPKQTLNEFLNELQYSSDRKFKREAKRLSKKFHSLKAELKELNKTLTKEPNTGTSLGNNIYKIRLAIKSKGKGKSGGGRIITYLINDSKEIYLQTIYDKSELDNIDDKTIKSIIQSLNLEN